MFDLGKSFSDFIGFHIRFQFLILSSLFVVSPVIISLNESLRQKSDFTNDTSWVEILVVLFLLFYAAIMLFYILSTGIVFIGHLLLENLSFINLWLQAIIIIFAIVSFILLELIANGAVAWFGFGRLMDSFGIDISEVSVFNERLWDRGCYIWKPDCQ